jgi:hypothetical protein
VLSLLQLKSRHTQGKIQEARTRADDRRVASDIGIDCRRKASIAVSPTSRAARQRRAGQTLSLISTTPNIHLHRHRKTGFGLIAHHNLPGGRVRRPLADKVWIRVLVIALSSATLTGLRNSA